MRAERNQPINASESNDEDRSKVPDLDHVAAALKGLRFGQVTVTVQDGVIVQIDRTERRRFRRSVSG